MTAPARRPPPERYRDPYPLTESNKLAIAESLEEDRRELREERELEDAGFFDWLRERSL